jgi:hypothetical protein
MGVVANLAVKISTNTKEFHDGLDRVSGGVKTLTSRLATAGGVIAGAFSVNAIGGAMEAIIEKTSRIADGAERIGVSAEAFQQLSFAAQQSGGSMSAIETSMRVMADKLTDGKLPKALTDMGLSVQALSAMAPDQAFLAIAQAVANIENPILQSSTAVDIFGRGAQALLPAIKAGFADIAATAPTMSSALINSSDQMGDKLDELRLRVDALKAQALLPLFQFFTELPAPIQMVMGVFSEFSGVLTGLALAVIAGGGPVAVFGALGTALTTVGGFMLTLISGPIGLLVAAVAGLTLVWVTFGDDITRIVTGVWTAVKTWLWDNLQPVLEPLGGLLASVGGMFTAFGDLVGAVASRIFSEVAERMVPAWSGITSAVETMVTTVKGWLDKIPTSLLPLLGPIGLVVAAFRHWDEIKLIAQAVYTAVKTYLVDKFVDIVNGVKSKVDAVTGFFRDMYDKVVGNSYVPDMVTIIGEQFGKLGGLMEGPTRSATSGVTSMFGGMFEAISGKFSAWGSTLGSLVQRTIGGPLASAFGSIANGLVGALSGILTGGISALLALAVPFVMQGLQKLGSLIWDGLQKFGGWIKDALGFGDDPEVVIGRKQNPDTGEWEDVMGRNDPQDPEHPSGGGPDPNNPNNPYVDENGNSYQPGDPNTWGMQSFASGGYGDFGSGTPAMLHGKEYIIPESQMGSIGGVNLTLNLPGAVITDDRSAKRLAEIVSRQLQGVMARYQPA